MKIIEIIINKAEIFNEVSLNSAYTGAKSSPEDSGFFDRVATVEADEELLSKFWTEMCGETTDRLREFIQTTATTAEAFKLTLEVSGSYDDSLTGSVTADISSAFTAGMCAGWFRFSVPALSEQWRLDSANLFRRAISKLCYRKRPQRP